jgi:hypothetical protein
MKHDYSYAANHFQKIEHFNLRKEAKKVPHIPV